MGLGQDGIGLLFRLGQLLLPQLVQLLLGRLLPPGDLLVDVRQLFLIVLHHLPGFLAVLFGLLGHLGVVVLPLFHKVLHRPVEQEVQPTRQQDEVEQVQQNLLPVDIQWDIHVPYLPAFTRRR